jgi:crotonyl-CoA carboxylase/reductase
MACSEQKIWGYETSWGSFAQFTKVQAQQLVQKPKHLGWEEAASYGLTFFTAYRMLVGQAQVKPGDNVLVWGAAGGLGIFAIQLCRVLGANPIAVVSSTDKIDLVKSLGAEMVINRREFGFAWRPNETPEQTKKRNEEARRFGGEIRRLTGGKDPDVVFEHVGQETFPTSVFVCKRFGKIVICGATSGFNLEFDVRYLWMRQKQIIGSHFANAYQAERANELMLTGKVRPVLDQVFDFVDTAKAHQLMKENKHKGKLGIRIQAPNPE